MKTRLQRITEKLIELQRELCADALDAEQTGKDATKLKTALNNVINARYAVRKFIENNK